MYFLPNQNNLTAVWLRLIGMHNEQNVIFENGWIRIYLYFFLCMYVYMYILNNKN